MGYLLKKMEPSALLYYHDQNAYCNKKDRLKNVHSSTSKLVFALLLSLALHSLLFFPADLEEIPLREHSIIHARLDKQDRELIQQEQTGQVSQQHNELISEASSVADEAVDQPKEQEATEASQQSQEETVVNTLSESKENTAKENIKEPEEQTQETEIEELVEVQEAIESAVQAKQSSQINSDSRAQIEALDGYEDPTYRSYHKVLTQYLYQRLEAHPELQGTVRLRIRIEYGSVATSVTIIQSSGNLDVDNWAKRAALSASPYPKIPKEIGSSFEFSPTLQLGQSIPSSP